MYSQARKLIGINYPALVSQLAPNEVLIVRTSTSTQVVETIIHDAKEFEKVIMDEQGEVLGLYAVKKGQPARPSTLSQNEADSDWVNIHRPVEAAVFRAITLGISVDQLMF